jgi:hypothetical protein
LVLKSLFVEHPFSPSHFISLCAFFNFEHKTIAVSGSIARRYRPASKGVTETIRRSMALALKAYHFRR